MSKVRSSGVQSNLLTGKEKVTQRVRVDVGQTGFWEGREFRLDLDLTSDYVVEFTSPVNFILQSQSLSSSDGVSTLNVYTSLQGVASGVFDEDLGILPNNGMTDAPAYTPQITALGGGSFVPNVGEKPRESIKVKTSNFTAFQSTVGAGSVPERGLPPGTYYLLFTGDDTSYRLVYEERP